MNTCCAPGMRSRDTSPTKPPCLWDPRPGSTQAGTVARKRGHRLRSQRSSARGTERKGATSCKRGTEAASGVHGTPPPVREGGQRGRKAELGQAGQGTLVTRRRVTLHHLTSKQESAHEDHSEKPLQIMHNATNVKGCPFQGLVYCYNHLGGKNRHR